MARIWLLLLSLAGGCAATVRAGDYFALPLERPAASASEARFRVQPAPPNCGTPRAPIVFLPGIGLSQHSWASVTAALGACRARVLVDLPGIGESPPTAKVDETAVLEDLTDVINAVAPDGGKVVLAGHSLGGALAARLAPRLGDRLEALVLVAAPVAAITLSFEMRALLKLAPVWPPGLQLAGPHFAVKLALPYVSRGGQDLSTEDVALLADDWSDHRRRRAILAYQRSFLTPAAIEENGAALAKVRAPTLLIWGGDDHVVPATVLATALQRLAQAKVTTVIVPYVGHLVPQAAPGAVAVAIDEALNALPNDASPVTARKSLVIPGRRPGDRIWGPKHEVFPVLGVGALFLLDGRTDLSVVAGVARGGIDRRYPIESGRLVLTVGAAVRDAPRGWSFAYLRGTARLELVWRWIGGYHLDGTLLVDPTNGHVGGYGAIGYTPSVVPWLRAFVGGGLIPGDSAPRFLVGMELDTRLTGWLY